MTEEIYKIISAIDREIGSVPVDDNGFYSPGSQMFVMGLTRAKDVIRRVVREDEE